MYHNLPTTTLQIYVATNSTFYILTLILKLKKEIIHIALKLNFLCLYTPSQNFGIYTRMRFLGHMSDKVSLKYDCSILVIFVPFIVCYVNSVRQWGWEVAVTEFVFISVNLLDCCNAEPTFVLHLCILFL